ncbi:MAG: DUF255 domain-containing protein [Dehalococcoidia bacterium]|nr:DUF255 domain-containing protein [Dehalococcoidia bacterium]
MVEFRFSPRLNRAHEIHWREWGPQAFQEAQSLDRPILLSISAVWCHWCHVLVETTYSDPRVMELVNREYLPVRVDNDRYPQVNQRYNMGGWPSTVFLTPRGDTLTGATYMPADGFLSIASQVLQYYRTQKAELYSHILQQQARVASQTVLSDIPQDAPTRVLDHLTETYDHEYGGFGTEPKFPQAEALELLLEEYHRSGEERLRLMLGATLRNMASGGMFDHVAGGFFRYSTNRDWSIPHYEKMCEDNASLLRVYLHAYQLLEGPASRKAGNDPDPALQLRQAAQRTVDYVMSALHDPKTGAFFGSQDADEEYYRLGPEERSQREAPFVDRTVYTPWNASMASSFLEASRVLERPDLEGVALAALEFLWKRLFRKGEGVSHYYDGQSKGAGLLVDQVWAAAAFLDAYETTGQSLYLERSRELAQLMYERFRDPSGGFYDIWDGYEGLGRLGVRDKSIVDNSLASLVLLRLYHLDGDETYRQAAEGALGAFAADYLKFGPYGAPYARAVGWLIEEPLRIEIVGEANESRRWREESLSFYHPHRLVRALDPIADGETIGRLGLPAGNDLAAYVCYRRVCSAPVQRSGDLRAAVESLVSGSGK